MKRALLWSAFWIGLAVAFNGFLFVYKGSTVAVQFFTGYLIEKSLSIDNLFAFFMLFSSFQIPLKFQRRVLYWGVLGALVMRFGLILGGSVLLERFHWLLYIFGGFLFLTGAKLAFKKERRTQKSAFISVFKKWFRVAEGEEGRFFLKKRGKFYVTSLFIALLAVEGMDLLFAVDSIPAIFAITTNPFIVYTSNAFAILGLRSLYFVLADLKKKLPLLKLGLSFILLFIGAKMLINPFYPLSPMVALGVIGGILAVVLLLPLLFPKRYRPN